MATSCPVCNGDLATAAQYNDLRTDVLTTHDHDGTCGNGTIQPSTVFPVSGNLTIRTAAGADVLIGDDVTILYVDGGNGHIGMGVAAVACTQVYLNFGAETITAACIRRALFAACNAITLGQNTTTISTVTLQEPNVTLACNTLTNAVSLYVKNAPTEGCNNYALWIDSGATQLDGTLTVCGAVTFNSGCIDFPATTVIGTVTNLEFGIATTVHQTVSNSGGEVIYRVYNTSNTGCSQANFEAKVGGTSAHDATFLALINGGQGFRWGLDNTSDIWALNTGGNLGTNDGLRMTAATPPVMSMNTTQGADFDYVCEKCGRHEAEPFQCCGLVKWHDDVLPMLHGIFNQVAVIDHLSDMGVLYRSLDNEGRGEVWMNTAPAVMYSWSMGVQNRRRMDSQYEELDRRLQAIGA